MSKPNLRKLMENLGQKLQRWALEEWSGLILVMVPIALLFCWGLDFHNLRRGEETNLVESAHYWRATLQNYGFTPTSLFENLGRSPLPIWLISLSQMIFGHELWGDRLLGALLNGASLPLLYWLGKELYSRSLPAFLTLVVYGTAPTVVYWARVASINSFVLPLTIACLASALFCRRDLRGGLPLGLTLSALALTNLPTSIVLFATSLVFLHWDTPRLKSSPLFGFGLVLGLLPAISWWLGYGFLLHGEIVDSIMVIGGSPWPLKLRGWLWLLASSPGLIFALNTFPRAQQALPWSWARFLLCQGGVYGMLVIISPWASTSLVMPLLVVLALAAGLTLAEIRRGASTLVYTPWWRRFFLTLAGLTALGAIAIHFSYGRSNLASWTARDGVITILVLVLLSLTLVMTSLLLDRQQPEFINVLFWGLFVCLFLVIYTPLSYLPPRSLPDVIVSTVSTTNQLPAEL
ncbi:MULTISPECIES: glycosyltransferase family 39 protein [unclassified Synechocystis]|nr:MULTISPECIES: glycosyltransferase family 39 protein [unclassified Synechocystis]UOO12370.1 glycosyltransferase family 39 protein [Synechocystis sp. PCC 6803]